MPNDLFSLEFTWTRLAKGFQNNSTGLCFGGVAGNLPLNGTVGPSTASASSILSGATVTPTTTFSGAHCEHFGQSKYLTMIFAVSAMYALTLLA